MDSAMTLQEAKSIARHLGLTLRKVRSGDYRVNFRDGNETTAYYTDDLEDAVNTAVEMAHIRRVGHALAAEAIAECIRSGRRHRAEWRTGRRRAASRRVSHQASNQ